MMARIAIAILTALPAIVLIGGILLAASHFLFIMKSRRVLGKVVSEWNYRMYGTQMRYYRVHFRLSNGQAVHLRSSMTSSSRRPKIGQPVPVFVREWEGKVKAKIGTITELWFEVFVLLLMGGVGSFLMMPIAYQAFSI